jgi:mannosyltransferase OCH1-like enzyme
MMIPRVIHQTWMNETVPAHYRRCADSWRKHHPGWDYRLWTDVENREFIQAHHPFFLSRYDSYPHHIQRVDAARYFLLFTFGGLYVDLDFECFRPLTPLMSERECLFGLEPPLHGQLHHRSRIISNALMATTPAHGFFHAIIDDLLTYEPPQLARSELILETTGPFMLERVYRRCGEATGAALLPAECLYPLTIFEAEQVLANGWNSALRQKVAGAYAAHYHVGTWWRQLSTFPQPDAS